MPSAIVVGGNNNTSSVNGRVNIPRQQVASVPVAKMYNSYGVSGTLSAPTAPGTGNLASRNVFGRLMRTQ